jgi:hypothetical protein
MPTRRVVNNKVRRKRRKRKLKKLKDRLNKNRKLSRNLLNR